MKALILNSGIGKRMGEYTQNQPKCMVPIDEKDTIISRQLNCLKKCGVRDVVITTGPFDEKLRSYIKKLQVDLNIEYVNNPLFTSTNYIYSIYLARKMLEDDVVLMHGDLVFTSEILQCLLETIESKMVISSTLPLPQKDFKAVVVEERIHSIGIEFFENAYAAQPLYKINNQDWLVWLREIEKFCEAGIRNCYAENAFNKVSQECFIGIFDVKDELCNEIDTKEDLLEIGKRLRKGE